MEVKEHFFEKFLTILKKYQEFAYLRHQANKNNIKITNNFEQQQINHQNSDQRNIRFRLKMQLIERNSKLKTERRSLIECALVK